MTTGFVYEHTSVCCYWWCSLSPNHYNFILSTQHSRYGRTVCNERSVDIRCLCLSVRSSLPLPFVVTKSVCMFVFAQWHNNRPCTLTGERPLFPSTVKHTQINVEMSEVGDATNKLRCAVTATLPRCKFSHTSKLISLLDCVYIL
jgi:hypothetical protein